MECLVVDAYNVINAWTDVFDLQRESMEDCRDRLLNILSNYQGLCKIKIIVVFDAHHVKGSQHKEESFDMLTVVYTKEKETADNYIERFVHQYSDIYTIRVVTSDYLEQRIVLGSGGVRMSPKELKEAIYRTNTEWGKYVEPYSSKTHDVISRIKPDILEKLEKIRRGGQSGSK
ncbi:MAG TPA: NYN domain-containing protein [Clostridiaceae bacterium]|nr:NYN domain-containing protein [Clostridiaceae bacterium]